MKEHPAKEIRVLFKEQYNIESVSDMARALLVDRATVSRVLSKKRSISVYMAIRLAYILGFTPIYWLTKQAEYDIDKYMQDNYNNQIREREKNK